jgi:hypothetical protein
MMGAPLDADPEMERRVTHNDAVQYGQYLS